MDSEERLSRLTNKLGDEFGILIYHLENELYSAWLYWKQFETLFAVNNERVELLNRSGGFFFKAVNKCLFETVIMSICRMIDPVEMRGNKNLVLEQLKQHIKDGQYDEELTKSLIDRIEILKSLAEPLKEYRHKVISHNDYNTSIGINNKAIVTLKTIRKALEAIHQILELINRNILEVESRLHVIDSLPNEESLLFRLYRGEQAEKQDDIEQRADWTKRFQYPEWLNEKPNDDFFEI